MFTVGRIGSYLSRGVGTVSGPFHPFGGAVDVVVVEQPDGSFKSSPWYVTFGKFQGVLKAREKVVDICVNGVEADFHMYLDHKGQAYFLKEVVGEEGESSCFHSSGDETDGQSDNKRRPMKLESSNIDASNMNSDDQNNVKMGRTVSRTNSRRARIFGLVFGRSSIKDDNCQEAEGGAVLRISSLERAEIAADLLELKWSTNLATSMSRKDHASRDTDTNAVDCKSDKDIPNDEQSQVGSPVHYTVRNSVDHSEMNEEIDKRNEETCSISHSSYENLVHLVGQASTEMQCLVPDIGASVASGVLEGASEAMSEISGKIDESSMGNADNDEIPKGDVSEISVPDSEIPYVLEAYAAKQFNTEQTCDERNVVLSGCSIFEEERESERVQSFIYCETSGSSTVELHGVGEQMQMQETMCFSCGDHGEVHVCSETVHVATELLAEEAMAKGTVDIEFEVDQHNISELSSQQEKTSPSWFCDGNKVNLEVPLTLSESYNAICSHEPVCDSAEGANSNGESNLDHQFHAEKTNIDETGLNQLNLTSLKSVDDSQTCHGNCVQRRALNIPPSHSLEEEQFLFSDLDELELGEVHPTEMIILDDVDKKNDPSFCPQGIMEVDDAVDIDESHSPPDKFVEHTLTDLEKSTPNSKVTSSLVNIPGTHVGKEAARLAESLPNMWSQIGNSGPQELHTPLSHSLDSNSEPLKWTLHSSCMESYEAKENQLPKEDADINANGLEDFKNTVSGPIIGDLSKAFATNGSSKIWPFSFKRSKSYETMQPSLNNARSSDADNLSGSITGAEKVMKKNIKVKTPSSEQLASLNLKEGSNSVIFTFSTPMLGRQQVDARIYLWKWNTRIVISDVDGTITKSDVLGQFMPLVGVDWSQTGVTNLFSAIKENGYQLLFLSARAISQAYHTRRFLVNLKQNGKALPEGPIVISPDGLFPSLFREVIRRAPHEFKIACLEDIKALFPPDCNPFYAGFGNRDTDEISYLKVGIPMGKIFIINPKGEVAVSRRVDTKSYSSLHDLVNGMFPPASSSEREDFNSWNFWKLPPSSIDN